MVHIISIFLFTPIRGVLLLLMPFLPIVIYKICPYTLSYKIIILFSVTFLISSILSLCFQWNDFANVLLSAYLFVPLYILFYAKPKKYTKSIDIHKFIYISVKFLLLVDFIGLLCWMKFGGDEFGMAYGTHYEYVHGLAMVNIMYFFYYISKIIAHKYTKKDITYAIALSLSFLLCAFGLGIVVLFLTIIVFFLIKLRLKYILIAAIVTYGCVKLLQSDYFEYERNNIEQITLNPNNARKAIMFYDMKNLLQENIIIPITGVGPGGYNSRVTFLLNGESSNIFNQLLGEHIPLYYQKYIYPLWNKSIVSMTNFTDGTRNKPNSSIIAIIAEYGIIIGIIIIFSFWRKIFYYKKRSNRSYLYLYLELLYIFMFISCLTHEWFITTEFILFLLLSLFTHSTLNNNGCPIEVSSKSNNSNL